MGLHHCNEIQYFRLTQINEVLFFEIVFFFSRYMGYIIIENAFPSLHYFRNIWHILIFSGILGIWCL